MSSFINWDDDILKESINKINNYDFRWICPAHGKPLKISNKLEV
jgi:hypothetical protein